MRLSRVLPFDSNAAPNEKGGVLYAPGSTAGRIANPDLYRELYLSLQPQAAIAEALGRLPTWHPDDFLRANGSRLALATYELSDDTPIIDLNSVRALAAFGIERPSEVVTRNRKITQSWARTIFEDGRYIGARWWSFYNPDWTSVGLWHTVGLRVIGTPEALSPEHLLVQKTAKEIMRQVVLSRS